MFWIVVFFRHYFVMACELRYWRLGESRGRKGFDNWFVNEKDGNACNCAEE